MNTIGSRLKEERKSLGYDQAQFGELGGVNRGSQSRYERDERSPDADYLAAIADAGADVCYIITGQRHTAARAPSNIADEPLSYFDKPEVTHIDLKCIIDILELLLAMPDLGSYTVEDIGKMIVLMYEFLLEDDYDQKEIEETWQRNAKVIAFKRA